MNTVKYISYMQAFISHYFPTCHHWVMGLEVCCFLQLLNNRNIAKTLLLQLSQTDDRDEALLRNTRTIGWLHLLAFLGYHYERWVINHKYSML